MPENKNVTLFVCGCDVVGLCFVVSVELVRGLGMGMGLGIGLGLRLALKVGSTLLGPNSILYRKN